VGGCGVLQDGDPFRGHSQLVGDFHLKLSNMALAAALLPVRNPSRAPLRGEIRTYQAPKALDAARVSTSVMPAAAITSDMAINPVMGYVGEETCRYYLVIDSHQAQR
jgi:hypothetical protein